MPSHAIFLLKTQLKRPAEFLHVSKQSRNPQRVLLVPVIMEACRKLIFRKIAFNTEVPTLQPQEYSSKQPAS